MLLLQTLQIYIDVGPGFVSMSTARIRRILSKQAGVVRSIIEKEKKRLCVYIECIHTCTCGDWQSLSRRSSPASIPVRRPNCCEDRLPFCCRRWYFICLLIVAASQAYLWLEAYRSWKYLEVFLMGCTDTISLTTRFLNSCLFSLEFLCLLSKFHYCQNFTSQHCI